MLPWEALKFLIQDSDINGDGRLDFYEFIYAVTSQEELSLAMVNILFCTLG